MSALPTFIVIGSDKCGTTSLHHYLGEHPEVQVSHPKELHYFCGEPKPADVPELTVTGDRERLKLRRTNWKRGFDWYRSHFDPSFAVRGESSPNYTGPWYPGTAERIAAAVPDVKLIYCVRDPVERALSEYSFYAGRGNERRTPDEALLPGGRYDLRSRFAMCLAPYLELFPRERIHVVEAERLDGDRVATMREAFEFLGVDPSFRTEAFERSWNVTARQRGLRFRALNRVRRLNAWKEMAARMPRSVLWVAEQATRSRTPAEPRPRPPVPPEFVDSLREDARRFREWSGLALDYWSV